MKPTDEQLEAIARAIGKEGTFGGCDGNRWRQWVYEAQAAWEVIAPMVRNQTLREAVAKCHSMEREEIARGMASEGAKSGMKMCADELGDMIKE